MAEPYNNPDEPVEEQEDDVGDELDLVWTVLKKVATANKEERAANKEKFAVLDGRVGNLEKKQGELESNQGKLEFNQGKLESTVEKYREEAKEDIVTLEQRMNQTMDKRMEAFMKATPACQVIPTHQLGRTPVVSRSGRQVGTPVARPVVAAAAAAEPVRGPKWLGPAINKKTKQPCQFCSNIDKADPETGRCHKYRHNDGK